jgi:hypothetical protein
MVDTMGFEEDDVVGDEEIEGEDMDIVGARGKAIRHALARRTAPRAARLRLPSAFAGASAAGISRPKEELDALPFTVNQPPAGVLAAGFASFAEAFPQRPFRGERLVAHAFKTNAGVVTDVSSLVVITPALYVGAVQVGASQGAIALSTFSSTAFGVRLAFPPAGQGTRVYIPYQLLFAQIAGDTTVITVTVIGRAVR